MKILTFMKTGVNIMYYGHHHHQCQLPLTIGRDFFHIYDRNRFTTCKTPINYYYASTKKIKIFLEIHKTVLTLPFISKVQKVQSHLNLLLVATHSSEPENLVSCFLFIKSIKLDLISFEFALLCKYLYFYLKFFNYIILYFSRHNSKRDEKKNRRFRRIEGTLHDLCPVSDKIVVA